jgi:hypothetical protein
MSKGLDLAKMEAAFKRAAYKAVHGTREERSGRFLPLKRGDAPSGDRASKQPALKRRKA